MLPIEASAYYEGTTCYDGSEAIAYYSCGMAKEYVGYGVAIYLRDGNEITEYLGVFKVTDTGNYPKIKDGTCVDIRLPDYDSCINFGRRDVYVQLIPPEDFENGTIKGLSRVGCFPNT